MPALGDHSSDEDDGFAPHRDLSVHRMGSAAILVLWPACKHWALGSVGCIGSGKGGRGLRSGQQQPKRPDIAPLAEMARLTALRRLASARQDNILLHLGLHILSCAKERQTIVSKARIRESIFANGVIAQHNFKCLRSGARTYQLRQGGVTKGWNNSKTGVLACLMTYEGTLLLLPSRSCSATIKQI